MTNANLDKNAVGDLRIANNFGLAFLTAKTTSAVNTKT